MYPGIDVTKVRLDRHYKLRDACSQGESVLWKIESRLDVVLWRSGMVATIPMAKQLVRSGKVELYHDGVWEVAKRSDQLLTSDTVMKLMNWTSLRTIAREKWTSKLYKHKVPAYRMMDYTEGIVTIRHKPLDGEVIVPSYLPIRVSSLMKRG
jgi:ribosomal protein S4